MKTTQTCENLGDTENNTKVKRTSARERRTRMETMTTAKTTQAHDDFDCLETLQARQCFDTRKLLLDKSSWSNSQYHMRVEWKRQKRKKEKNTRTCVRSSIKLETNITYCLKVGAREFIGTSAQNVLSKLTINVQRRTKALKALSETADRFGVERMSSTS
ncbi:hypothetical protein PoB_006071100 [Plakobranchus ocellatus]|uniref:Uncharacterized protein n=1 Tax=Plakobranchus ocellatus TaxID=259542 RepID=A0AAV4CQS0_9GAST|nr:hypothetical protein PoB_006071100 [Plakobranchus ocellatus]